MTDHARPTLAEETPGFDPADDYLLTFTPVPTRTRRDGWTEARQRGFIAELRRHGSVRKAAQAVGMSHQSAWRLRAREKAEAFAAAWERASDEAASVAFDRALEVLQRGVVQPRYYRGRYIAMVHRYDNRLALAALRDRARPRGR